MSASGRIKGIFLRGSVYWLRCTVNGKQIRRTLDTTNEATAVQLAREILGNPVTYRAGVFEQELADYFNAKRESNRLSENSIANRGFVLRKFAALYEIDHPSDIRRTHVQAWYEFLQTKHPEHTAQPYVRWLKTFLRHLVANRKLTYNPADGIEMHRLKKAKRRPFCSKAETQKLIAECADESLKFVLYCGFHAGLRKEEIIQARPEWFDLERKLLHLERSDTWKPKDDDDRTIPITSEFRAFLDTYGLRAPFMLKPEVEFGKSRYRYDFRRPFADYVKSKGLEWVTPHVMRRTFASLLVSAGVSPYKVASWIGDGIETFQTHYGYLQPKDSDIERGLA